MNSAPSLTIPNEPDQACTIKCLSYNPQPQKSWLGDVGYLDTSGAWRSVLNAVDESTCRKHGVKAIQLTHELKEYIIQRKRGHRGEPVVKIFDGGGYQVLAPDQLASYI